MITATTYALKWHKDHRPGRYYAQTYTGALNEWSPTGCYRAEFVNTRWQLTHVEYDGDHNARRVPGMFTRLRDAKAAAEADRRR